MDLKCKCLGTRQLRVLTWFQLQMRTDEIGLDRQFAATTLEQDHEPDRPGPPIIEDLVHCRAHGATGI